MAKQKKILIVITILIALSLLSVVIMESLLSNTETPNTDQLTSDQTTTTKIKVSSLLEGVHYVSQETGFFCHYASCTMIFKYFNIDTSLREVLYFSGIGYSSLCQSPIFLGGYLLSQQPDDIEFLASLYGLSFSFWYPEIDELSDEKQYWPEYWLRIKQNISNDIPIATGVDPMDHPSLQKQFDVSEDAWEKFQSMAHSIVIVGYNESNNTVCYFDPIAKYLGNAKYGIYAWMSINNFKEAVTSNTGTKYLISSFKKTTDPLPKSEAFKKAHKRNIERLKGNFSAYGGIFSKYGENFVFGISASNALKQDFGRGLQHRIKTILFYKITGKAYRRQNRRSSIHCLLNKIPISVSKTISPYESEYYRISIEKQYAAEYLKSLNSSFRCGSEVAFLEQEAEMWSEISNYYEKFIKRGFLIRLPRAILIVKTMENIMKDIISIEESIITSTTSY